MRVLWPHFTPATHVGVPVYAEVEYRLIITLRPPKRFPSSTQATRVPEDTPVPHMEWFHSTVFPKNATAE